jgi:hypothetical protein
MHEPMKDERGESWQFGKYVTLEHVRLGWVVGVEFLLGNLYLSFGRYVIIIHQPREV